MEFQSNAFQPMFSAVLIRPVARIYLSLSV